MTIAQHVDTFAGRPVRDYDPTEPLTEPTEVIYRLGLPWDAGDKGDTWADLFATFLRDPRCHEAPGLIVGAWDDPAEADTIDRVLAELVRAADRLPRLDALFVGDITYEECEISWIQQADITPLLTAYPRLRTLRVRGGVGLHLGPVRHPALEALILESGGLDAAVVRAVAAAHLPNLRHLELWLGTPEYGATATIDDLTPILAGTAFPRLQSLGLRDSAMADEVAEALAEAPVLTQVRRLDLSLGTLTDRGARALLGSQVLAPWSAHDAEGRRPGRPTLDELDLHHHFLSPEMVATLRALPLAVNLEDRQEADVFGGELHRYVAVGE